MTFYYVLWGTFFILSLPYLNNNKRESPFILLLLLIIPVAYLIACRVDVGADWGNYVSLYNTGETLTGEDTRFEPLFKLSRLIFYPLGFSYQGYFFVFTLLSMYAIAKVARGLGVKNLFFAYLVYISTIFCPYYLNTFRSCLMATCIWISFLKKSQGNTNDSIFWCLVGGGFHYIGLAFLPILYLIDRQYKKKFVVSAVVLSYIVLILNLGAKLIEAIPQLGTIERLAMYTDVSNVTEYGISMGAIFNLCVFMFCYFKYQESYEKDTRFRVVLNALFIVMVFSALFNAFGTIVSRFGQVLNMSLIFVWPILFERINNKIIRFSLLAPVIVYLIMYYNKSFVISEILGYSTIVPFKFEVASFFR